MEADVHLYLKEARIFFITNSTKTYLHLNESRLIIQGTTDGNNASLFTLITTQENHQLGRFEIGEVTTEGVNNLIMKRSITTVTNQDGPYQLSTNTQGFFFNTYGNSNTKLI